MKRTISLRPLPMCRLFLTLAILPFAGCTPDAVRQGMVDYKNGADTLGRTYDEDLGVLSGRLDKAAEIIRLQQITLLKYQNGYAARDRDALSANARALIAETLASYDRQALKLVTSDFEQAFQERYMTPLRPKFDELRRRLVRAEEETKAAPGNAARAKAWGELLGKNFAQRVEAGEAYRLAQLRLGMLLADYRTGLVANLEKHFAAGPAAPVVIAEPAPALSLSEDVRKRRAELVVYREKLANLGEMIDRYLRTHGYADDLVKAFGKGVAEATLKYIDGKIPVKDILNALADPTKDNDAALTEAKKLAQSFADNLRTKAIAQGAQALSDELQRAVVTSQDKNN